MASPVLASPDQHSRRWSLPTIFRWQDNTTGDDVEYEVSDMFSAELPPSPVNSIHPPPPVKPALSTTPTSAFGLSPSVSHSTATTKSFTDHSRPANSSLDSLRYLPGYPTAPSSPITVTTDGSDSWTTFPSTAITTSTTASIPSTTPIAPPPSRRQLVVQSHDFSSQQQQLQKTLLSFPVPTVTMTTTTVPSASSMPIFVPLTQRPDHPLGGVKSPQPSAGVLAADSPIGADRVADSFLLGSSAPELNADLSISSQVKPPAHVAIPVGTATTTTDRVLHPAPQATAASPPLPRRASNLSSSGRVSTTSTHISIPAPSHSARRHHPRDHSLDPTWSIISDKPNLNLTNQGSPDGPTSRYVPITTTRPAARPNDPTRRQWAIYLGLIALVIILTVCIWPIVNAVAGLIVLPILLIFILVVIIVWYHRKHMGALSAANIMASETGAAGAAMHRPAGYPTAPPPPHGSTTPSSPAGYAMQTPPRVPLRVATSSTPTTATPSTRASLGGGRPTVSSSPLTLLGAETPASQETLALDSVITDIYNRHRPASLVHSSAASTAATATAPVTPVAAGYLPEYNLADPLPAYSIEAPVPSANVVAVSNSVPLNRSG